MSGENQRNERAMGQPEAINVPRQADARGAESELGGTRGAILILEDEASDAELAQRLLGARALGSSPS